MDLLFIHLTLLLWLSVAASRRWTDCASETLLGAAALAWINLLVTALLLSCVHRFGDVRLGLIASVGLAGGVALLAWRHPLADRRPADSAVGHPAPHYSVMLTLALLAAGSVVVAAFYVSLDPNTLGNALPRALQYLGDGSLFSGASGEASRTYFTHNYGVLHAWILAYKPELTALNFVNLTIWLLSGCAVHRFCHVAGASRDASLLATGCALTARPVLTQAITLDHHLAAGAALVAGAAFILAWSKDGRKSSAFWGGAFAGLAGGSSLGAAAVVVSLSALAAMGPLRVRQRGGWSFILPGLAVGLLPTLVSFALAVGHDSLARLVANAIASETATLDFAPARGVGGVVTNLVTSTGIAGSLCLGAALFSIGRARREANPISRLGLLGLGWALVMALPALATRHSPQLAPALLLTAPCIAAALDLAALARSRWIAIAAVFLIISVWSGRSDLIHDARRPLGPLLDASQPRLSSTKLRAALKQRFDQQTRINISPPADQGPSSDSSDLAVRSPSYDRVRTDAYNIFSRPHNAHNRALSRLHLGPAYVLIPFPGKPTPGVEPLGSTADEAADRDYFGIAGRADLQVLDNNGLLLATVERQTSTEAQPRLLIDAQGLNRPDDACLEVFAETEDGQSALLATFSRSGEQTAALPASVRALRFRLRNAGAEGAPRGTAVLEALPPDQYVASASRDPRVSFAHELVARDAPPSIATDRKLLPAEGPFPDSALPLIRWMRSDRIALRVPAVAGVKTLRLSLSARLYRRHQGILEIICNGQPVRRLEFDDAERWQDISLEFAARTETNTIELHELPPPPGPDWGEYLNRYPDVRRHVEMMRKPLIDGAREHYEACGRAEGRTVVLVAAPQLAPDTYFYMFRSLRVEGLRP
ncbi:MAG: hypothetical protein HYV96_17100 [Opitutae bacterium]|nr:hypothetical protein [Opitutae bacterium]